MALNRCTSSYSSRDLASVSQIRRYICQSGLVYPLISSLHSQFHESSCHRTPKIRFNKVIAFVPQKAHFEVEVYPTKAHIFEAGDLLFFISANKVKRLFMSTDSRLRTSIIVGYHKFAVRSTSPKSLNYFVVHHIKNPWNSMRQDNIRACLVYQRVGPLKHDILRNNGRMMPYPNSRKFWRVLTMDHITELPMLKGLDVIMTAVDKLFMRYKCAAVHTNDEATDGAKFLFDTVVCHHGLPEVIISDTSSRQTSEITDSDYGSQDQYEHCSSKQRDGQTERQDLDFEDALR